MRGCNLDQASCQLFRGLIDNLLNPAMLLLTGAAAVVFIFGVVEFLWFARDDSKAFEKGKNHMIWGIVGLLIMVAAWAIIMFIQNTVVGIAGGQ